jgi:superfamily I DNA and/or RNA helicase
MPYEHFTRLLELLRLEKEEDRRQYLETVRRQPLSKRVENGFSWFPLTVLQTGFALGEKAFVVLERTTRLDEPHQLRAGQSVSLFTQQPHVDEPERSGVINYVQRNRLKIILNARDVPEWLSPGPLGVDLLFDERSYREMERALENVIKARGDRLAELRDLFLSDGDRKKPDRATNPANPTNPLPGDVASSFVGNDASDIAEPRNAELNPGQRRAIDDILHAPAVAVVHGPPGPGKTTTLVAAIVQLCERESTVLVTAPSNTAADLLTERLAAAGLRVVRVGNISRVDEHVLSHTLEAQLARHPESRNIRKVKLEAAEARRQSRRYKRSFGAEDRREREHLRNQARDLEAWAIALEDRLLDQILTSAQAITCTLVGAANPVLERYRFRTCVIDEAAQALEPATWIPIAKASRVVLAGDPFQLPPTVKNPEAARGGLAVTLIERCLQLFPDRVNLLTVQYRMHRAIMGFSNRYFYGGALEAHDSVGARRLAATLAGDESEDFFDPVLFIDTSGTGFEERVQESAGEGSTRSLSRFNPEEALLVREHLLQLLEKFPPGAAPSIGVLSPYREQVNCLEALLREDARFAGLMTGPRPGTPPLLIVNTIDGFQGQERDVIYISLVRSNPRHEIGFLSDYRRMNVAMTRARMLLVVIGDSATIGKNRFYQAFLDYCAEHGQWQTAWQYLR